MPSPTPLAMYTLSLSLFTAAHDEEAGRYRVLSGLQQARLAFARNEVYPHLGDLIRLHEALGQVTTAAGALRGRQRGPLRGIDLEAGQLLYDAPTEPPLLAESLIEWALPRLRDTIEEGRMLYEFAEEHAALRAVGIVPAYQDEGYLLIPSGQRLRILRYGVSLFEQPDGRYRSLRTTEVAAAPPYTLPATLKRTLVARDPSLPNPAMFQLESDVDLPVEATVLPIAKRKLLQYLTMGGEFGTA
jgi:hypothetical protein